MEKNVNTFEGVLTNEQTELLQLIVQGLGASQEDIVDIEIPLHENGQLSEMNDTAVRQVLLVTHQVFEQVNHPPVGKEARERLRKPIRQQRAGEINKYSGARQIREENNGF